MSIKPAIKSEELEQLRHYFQKDMPDYSALTNGADLLEALETDPMKWAVAFCQFTKKKLDIDINFMYVQGWFANFATQLKNEEEVVE